MRTLTSCLNSRFLGQSCSRAWIQQSPRHWYRQENGGGDKHEHARPPSEKRCVKITSCSPPPLSLSLYRLAFRTTIRTSAELHHGERSSGPKTWGECPWVRQIPCPPTSGWPAAARHLPPRSQRGARWTVSSRVCMCGCGRCAPSLLRLAPVEHI